MGLSPDAKERFAVVFELTKTAVHWGFIPAVLYLGFRKGAEIGQPPLSFLSLLWQ